MDPCRISLYAATYGLAANDRLIIMPLTISNEAFVIPLVLAALLYVLGFWAQLAFPQAVSQYGRLAVNPILGLISVTTLLTTASYLGYSIPAAAIFVLLVYAPFSFWGASRAISGKMEKRWDSLWLGGAVAFVIAVFLWPYANDRAFYVFAIAIRT